MSIPGDGAAASLPSGRHRNGAALLRRALFGIFALALFAGGGAWLLDASIDPSEEAEGGAFVSVRHAALAEVRSWIYQPRSISIADAARTSADLIVVDADLDGIENAAGRTAVIKALQHKSDSSRRLVLAALPVGEAQDSAPYWEARWTDAAQPGTPRRALEPPALGTSTAHAGSTRVAAAQLKPLHVPSTAAPPWLGDENPDRRGKYRVRFWDAAWQDLLLGSATAALDRMLAAGFDGVYLDHAGAHAQWAGEHQSAKGDMIALITRISAYAKQRSPDFIVLMHNAEELLGNRRLRQSIDAVAKEDLLHGPGGTVRAGDRDIGASLKQLIRAQRDGLPVFVIEHVAEGAAIAEARRRLAAFGFLPTFAGREPNGARRVD